MTLRLGDTIGAYEVTGILGSGGSGQVYEVKHTVTGRVEALKRLRGAGYRDPERDERLLREVRLQAKLNHPNIAAVHNAFWLQDDLIMILELVRGRSLQRVLDVGKTPIVVALDYASQVLFALDYTHRADVIHRDITPSNILITPEGVVKLTDFGLAKPKGDPVPAAGVTLAGSVYYMSPEQIRATNQIDYRSDLYSLGVVLYEIVTGRLPFQGENLYGVMEAHVEQTPIPPSELGSQVSPGLNDVILKAMEKDPAKRFQSAVEFESALATASPLAESRAAAALLPSSPRPATAAIGDARERGFRLPRLAPPGDRALIAATSAFVVVLAIALWRTFATAPSAAEQHGDEPAPHRP